MPKPTRGGQRGAGGIGAGGPVGRGIGAGGVGSFMAPPPPPQQQPAIPNNATPPSLTQQQFMQMDNKQTIQYLGNLKNVKMPPSAELPEFDTQRLTYDMGLNDKPRIVSEAEFNKTKGETIYRGVHELKDGNGTVLAPARSVANVTMYGEFSRIGAGVAGDGFYFTTGKGTANGYAGGGKDLGKSAVMRAKIDGSKAKTITLSALERQFNNEDPYVQNAFMRMSTVDNEWTTGYLGAYALKKGYNVITRPALARGESHYIILDRSVMIMCNTITPKV